MTMKLFVITGTCGAGKSTMKDRLADMLDSARYACVDSDEVGLNWRDYAGTEKEARYGEDTLRAAVKMAEGRDLGQYRTTPVRQMRSQIFRQIA